MTTSSAGYTVGGTVQAGGGLYIPRQADAELLALCRAGEFAYVLTSRQMGKSSLMVRTASALAEQGARSVIIDLTQLGVQVTAQEWYLGLLSAVEDALALPTNVITWWNEHTHLSVTNRLTLFFEEILLAEVPQDIVIFIDEIDSTLSLSFTDDFYAAIRFFYNARAFNPQFKRLSFVLIGVATPGDLIADAKRTPFNIGRRVDLTDFTFAEALPLADGLSLPDAEARQVLGWILKWTGGHPYLTQRTCRIVADRGQPQWTEAEIDKLVTSTFLGEMSEQDNNLQFVRDMLTKRAPNMQAVLSTYQDIRLNKRPVPDEEQSLIKSHLKLSGVVKREKNLLITRNRIYAEVFNPEWIKTHLPIDDRHRRALFVGMGVGLGVAVFVAVYAISLLLRTIDTIQANQATVEAVSATQTVIRGTAEAIEGATATAQAKKQVTAAAVAAYESQRADVATSRQLAAEALNQIESGDPDLALLLSLQANRITTTWEARSSLLIAVERYPVAKPITPLDTPAGNLWSLAFSPNGSLLAAGSQDGMVLVWDVKKGQAPLHTLGTGSNKVWKLAFSPDGQTLASGNEGGQLILWDVASGQAYYRYRFTDESDVTGIAFSPSGEQLYVSLHDGVIGYWGALGAKPSAPAISRTDNKIIQMALEDNGATLITTSGDKNLTFYSAATRRKLNRNISTGKPISYFALGPDGKTMLVGHEDGSLEEWDASTPLRTGVLLPQYQDGVTHIAFSPDGKLIATASWDYESARLWDAATRRPVSPPLSGHIITVSPDGRLMATAGCAQWTNDECTQGRALLWEIDNQPRVHTLLSGHTAPVARLAFSPTANNLLASGDEKGPIIFWDLPAGKILAAGPLQNKTGSIDDLAFSPDGALLVSANGDGSATVWDTQTRQVLSRLEKQTYAIKSIAFSPNGEWVASGSCQIINQEGICAAGEIRLWSAQTGQPVGEPLIGHTGWVWRLAFSPNGQTLVSGSEDGSLIWWDISAQGEGRLLHQSAGHTSDVLSLAFSPNGQTLISGSCRTGAVNLASCTQGEIILWDAKTWQPLREPLSQHNGWVTDLAFSPDGALLASAACNSHAPDTGDCLAGEIYLWDAAALQPMSKPLVAHTGQVSSLAFNAAGSWLASGSTDTGVIRWDLNPADWQKKACLLAKRNMSRAEWAQFMGPDAPYQRTCANLPAGEGSAAGK